MGVIENVTSMRLIIFYFGVIFLMRDWPLE